jgi:3-oxoadipate enol-lactonase
MIVIFVFFIVKFKPKNNLMPIQTLDSGANLYYEYYLFDESLPTIVFINGLSQSTAAWALTRYYLGSDGNYLFFDNFFQGQSDKEGDFRTFEEHAAETIELCQKLKIKKIIPAGISYGSAIAMRIMVNYPEYCERAALMSAFAYKTTLFDTIGHSWKRALEIGGYDLMLDVMIPNVFGMPYFDKPVVPFDQLRAMRSGLNEQKTALLKLMQATEVSGNYLERLRYVKMPVLIIQGELDILTTPSMAKDIKYAIQGSELRILEGKGHSLNIEAASEIARYIKYFGKDTD